jgi:hypothetical protein
MARMNCWVPFSDNRGFEKGGKVFSILVSLCSARMVVIGMQVDQRRDVDDVGVMFVRIMLQDNVQNA